MAEAEQKDFGGTRGRSAAEVFFIFLRLGCTSFGGPIAHLGYFRQEFVQRRCWLPESAFAELIALAQTLPGPASSQVGFALGLLRAGWPGGLAAFLGFTLPSAALMVGFALGSNWMVGPAAIAALHGLRLVAVAVVAQAVWSMQRSLAPDLRRMLVAAAAGALALALPSPHTPLLVMAVAASVGLWLCRETMPATGPASHFTGISRTGGLIAATVFVVLLLAAPALGFFFPLQPFHIFSVLYRSGALVFGGGHVVLPLLERTVVAPGGLPQASFLSGYAAAQALPGPLFSFGAYVGAAMAQSARPPGNSFVGALAGLLGLFAPGLLLMAAVLPFWGQLRRRPALAAAVRGINAGVIGLLLAALVRPLAISSLRTPMDWLIAAASLAFLLWGKLPAWVLVLGVATGAALWHRL